MARRIVVESSNILAVSYLRKQEALTVEFKNGSVYRYLKVPYKIYIRFLRAKKDGGSYGEYFCANIRDIYEFHRIDEAPVKEPDIEQQLKDSIRAAKGGSDAA